MGVGVGVGMGWGWEEWTIPPFHPRFLFLHSVLW